MYYIFVKREPFIGFLTQCLITYHNPANTSQWSNNNNKTKQSFAQIVKLIILTFLAPIYIFILYL